jgi:monoamine oxidase
VKTNPDVIVVGAGAAGLAATAMLTGAGASVLVLEGRARAGGRIFTRRVRGWPMPVELGAEFIHGRAEEVFEIAREGGLLIERLPDAHLQATAAGWRRTHDLWSRFEAVTRQMKTGGRDRSAAEFLRSRRSLSPPQKRLASGLIEGYHAAHLDRVSEHWLSTSGNPTFAEERAQFRMVSGYDGVTRHLLSGIDPARGLIRFSTPVRRIRWRKGSVTVGSEGGGEFRAGRVVVTVPAAVLRAGAGARAAGIEFDPDPPAHRRALQRIEAGHALRLVLRFREPVWEGTAAARGSGPSGVGYLHRWDAAFPTWWTAAPAEVPMMTAWAGGPAAERLARLPSAQIVPRAVETLAAMLELDAARVRRALLAWHMHDWSADPFSREAYSYAAVGGASAADALARPAGGTLFFAGEATDREQSGTVPGAIASGRRAARQVLSTL